MIDLLLAIALGLAASSCGLGAPDDGLSGFHSPVIAYGHEHDADAGSENYDGELPGVRVTL